MSRVLIWGAGNISQNFIHRIDLRNNELIGFVDNDTSRQGQMFYSMALIYAPESIKDMDYDLIIVCLAKWKEVIDQCKRMKLRKVYLYEDETRIFSDFPELEELERFKSIRKDEIYKKCTYLAIKQIIQPVIDEFHGLKKPLAECKNEYNRIMWTCWWQGEEEAPFLVQKCFQKMRLRAKMSGYKVIVITQANWNQYIDLPEYILKKLERKIISLTHLSDIIRIKLLLTYGGVWADATVYIPDSWDEQMDKYDFYSVKLEDIKEFPERILVQSVTFSFMKAKAGNVLMHFLDKAGCYYWERKETLIEFYLFAYMVIIAYHEFDCIKDMIDLYPVNNQEYEGLGKRMNDVYSKGEFEQMKEKTSLFKLSNRTKKREYASDGSITFYGAFTADLI